MQTLKLNISHYLSIQPYGLLNSYDMENILDFKIHLSNITEYTKQVKKARRDKIRNVATVITKMRIINHCYNLQKCNVFRLLCTISKPILSCEFLVLIDQILLKILH